MNKRFLPLLLVLFLLFSALTGCAGEGGLSDAQGGGEGGLSGENGGQKLSPEEQKLQTAVDPSCAYLPDLRDFLYVRPGIDESYYSDGHQFQWLDSIPIVACDDVEAELLSLLSQPRYQLELVESFLDPHYSDQIQRYLYRYTGTSEAITLLGEKYGEYEFHVRLTIKRYVGGEYDREYFRIDFEFNENFQLEDPGIRTSRDITYIWDGGTGAIITEAPDTGKNNSDDDSRDKEWCTPCGGSGDCSKCDGDGEIKKFQAGVGYVTQRCTSCGGRGNCKYCGGDGER